MDPDACFSELLSAVADGDGDEARQHAENLITWLQRGGFSPGGEKLRKTAIVSFCDWVTSTYQVEE